MESRTTSLAALVSNIDFDRWGDYLADGPLAMAFLDRLIEGAIIIKIKGDSYRDERRILPSNESVRLSSVPALQYGRHPTNSLRARKIREPLRQNDDLLSRHNA